jgi:hypothetical protein
LSLALFAAVLLGAVVFATLLGVFVVGYLVALVHAWGRLARLRRRAVFVEKPEPAPSAGIIQAEYEVVEVVGDRARPRTGGPA